MARGAGGQRPSDAARALRKLETEIRKPITKAISKTLSRAKGEAVKGFRGIGLGRRLWGAKGKGSGAALMVAYKPRARWSMSTRKYLGGLEAKGIAGLMELGGSTKPHLIKPKKKALRFAGRSGVVFRRLPVRHPGGRVRRTPQMEPALKRAAARLPQDMEAAMAGSVRSVGL